MYYIKFNEKEQSTCFYEDVHSGAFIVAVGACHLQRNRVDTTLFLEAISFLFFVLTTGSLSRTSVSEDADYEDIYGKHDEGTLDPNHELLPGELKVTWKNKSYRDEFDSSFDRSLRLSKV